ncbi:MAG TPA: hypothetical protein VEU51_12725 [Candidatus Acidoferrales bacterium]|nr:hypothetical protein [Candidatus Acidoferrales bacterium]
MSLKRIATIISTGAVAVLVGGLASPAVSQAQDSLQFELTPSSAKLAECMPDASLVVTVKPNTDKKGSDNFVIQARNLPPNRTFTVFLLQQATSPFGAAEYIGDVSTNGQGDGRSAFNLIVGEAFSSTIVNGGRLRVDLNRIGVWFSDPADDDFCFGNGGGSMTPFDGDGVAGVQAFNSANADPLPAP